MNKCIDTVAPEHLEDTERQRIREGLGERKTSQSIMSKHIKTNKKNSNFLKVTDNFSPKCPPVKYTHMPAHTYWPKMKDCYSGAVKFIKSRHGNMPTSWFARSSPIIKTAGITHQNPNSRELNAEDKTDGDFRSVRVYLGVEALSILGYSVELREAEHVLLATRPVKNPQSKWRQRSKYLQHRKQTHAAVETGRRKEARILCLSRCSHQILSTKRNSIMFKKRGA